MKTDKNGCSTCPNGQERYEFFTSAILGRECVQYDFRHPSGKLFSTVAPSLENARQRLQVWLAKNFSHAHAINPPTERTLDQ